MSWHDFEFKHGLYEHGFSLISHLGPLKSWSQTHTNLLALYLHKPLFEQFDIQLTISIFGDNKRFTGKELFDVKSNTNVLFSK